MIELLTLIDEIIHKDFKVSGAGGYILVEEKVQNYPETKVGCTGKILVYQFDKDGVNLFPFFQTKVADAKKICDYVVFCPDKDIDFVFLCELKSGKPESGLTQLLVSKFFVEYLLGVTAVANKMELLKIEMRGLILSTQPPYKQKFKTKVSKQKDYKEFKGFKYRYLKAGDDLNLDELCF